MQEIPNKSLVIDEEGDIYFGENRLADEEAGLSLLRDLRRSEKGIYLSHWQGEDLLVEAFDHPLVVRQVEPPGEQDSWQIKMPYGFCSSFELKDLSLDEWDRFNGLSREEIPFVFSRSAQMEFFRLLEDYDDEHIVFAGQKLRVPDYFIDREEVSQDSFWTSIYQQEEKPGWDLGQASPVLKDRFPRLKQARSRILVLGCGAGHDAAYLASQGHVVTGVDMSSEAIEQAKTLYGSSEQLQWLLADALDLPKEMESSFDLVFEHTCYCAISPKKRGALVETWLRVLRPGGYLMAVFFVVDKRQGPPWGGTEYEVRQRLKKRFSFLFWQRAKESLPRRLGKELFVFAQKKHKDS